MASRFYLHPENLDAHRRLLVALGLGLLTGLAFTGRLPNGILAVVSWDVFASSLIGLSWFRIIWANAKAAVQTAQLEDAGRSAILFLVIAGACASLFAVGLLLGFARGLKGVALTLHLVLAGGTVALSWFLIHTLFALHYAYLHYSRIHRRRQASDGQSLLFPGTNEPDYLDFAYFSFVIGTCAQVSDVQIVGRSVRRLALFHGVLSFAFNTLILALTINLASGLFG
jgi:uncharacterized membrane protein